MATIANSYSNNEAQDGTLRSADTHQSSNNANLQLKAIEIFQGIIEFLSFSIQFWWLVIVAILRLFVPVPPKSVKGEIVLITGAGNGIGRELALQYASQGATVVCWDINEKGNLETVGEIAKLGYPKAHPYVCDVVNRDQVMQVSQMVLQEVGDVTILINNAGIMPCHPFLDHTTDEIERIMNINVMAHFWTLQAFLPTMKKNNYGHIVAISSMAGIMGVRYLMPYCASKFAVRGMMEGLHQDLSVDPNCQIKTTVIYPYAVETGLFNVKNIKCKFPSLIQVLKPNYVAKYIMNAQRRDVHETSIPRHFLSMNYYGRLFPIPALAVLMKYIDSYIGSDL